MWRIWLLPLEWLEGSIAAGVKLPEAAYDFERQQDAREQEEGEESVVPQAFVLRFWWLPLNSCLARATELQQLCSRSRSPRKMRKKNDGTAEVSSDIGGSDAPGSAKAASGPSGSEDGKAQRRNKDDATLSLADAQNGQIRETEESPHVDRDDIGGLARDIALQVANDFEKLRAYSLMLSPLPLIPCAARSGIFFPCAPSGADLERTPLGISGGGGASGKQAVDENRQREGTLGPETDWRSDRQFDLSRSFLLVIASVVASFLSKWN